MIRDFVKAVTKQIDTKLATLRDTVAAGACPDHPTYRHYCGRIQELKEFAELLTEEAQKYDRED